MSLTGSPGAARRIRARVDGTVQGVGFRPHVYRLADELGLGGWVLNDERGVVVEAEGPAGEIERFVARLRVDAPPLARVESVVVERVPPAGERAFSIRASGSAGPARALVAPDTATCDDCLSELFDPADRRHRYPFVNCTNCGPRFTIVRGVPYDRPRTTMAGFEMCAACRAEYEDPRDRRFHAEPIACPDCGPRARLVDPSGGAARGAPADAVAAAAEALLAGRIVAVKGIGGYHLACRADAQQAVVELRARKRRDEKPFAVMAPDLAAATALAELSAADRDLLLGPERPIVIAPRRPEAAVAPAVAPRSRDLGVMLPYSPLHHLLMADAGTPLVMTSGNVSDEPIAHEDADALERLGAIADLLLVHDRPIHVRTDDSVVRSTGRGPILMRRSRGHVPLSLRLPLPAPPLLACGAELKSTFCVAKGERAWVGHHIGDLKNWETLRSFRAGAAHFERLFEVEPELVVHDLHPDYLSTGYALERAGVEHVAVQHHHAHLAAVLAEHGERGPAVGAIYDGTGHGTDGAAWGGEILAGDLAGFERAGHLRPVRMPGGDRAVHQPWRMACAWLRETLETGEPALPPALAGRVAEAEWNTIGRLAGGPLARPETTSVGRLLDAAAAICGVRHEVSYEGQAAIELEALAAADSGAYSIDVVRGARLTIDPRAALGEVLRDVASGAGAGTVSARFHAGLARATAAACEHAASARGLDTAVLAGGVFQNRLLLEWTADLLAAAGLRVLVPRLLPPGDGAIAYGQAAAAAALAEGR